MPTPMNEWLATAVAKYQGYSLTNMSHAAFFRDPPRTMHQDRDLIFSPADGTILYQKRVDPDSDLIETKGVHVTLNDLLGPHAVELDNRPCMVVGIFMSFYDVHINRMPTDGLLTHYHIPSLRTGNIPMLWVEKGIVQKSKLFKKNMQYVADNSRVVNEVYVSSMRYKYFMVQIGDSDVNTIMHFSPDDHAHMNQCQRFSLVRWGSQVDLILPLDSRYKFKPVCQVTDHVEAATDVLLKIERTSR